MEEENNKLKKFLAERDLKSKHLKRGNTKKLLNQDNEVMKTIIDTLKRFGIRIKRIKEILRIPRSSYYEILKDKEKKGFSLIESIQKIVVYEFPFYE